MTPATLQHPADGKKQAVSHIDAAQYAALRLLHASAIVEYLQFGDDVIGNAKRLHSRIILFTPGNPGVIAFYEQFLAQLKLAVGSSCGVIGFGLTGHSHYHIDNTAYTVKEQVDHRKEIVSVITRLHPGCEVILIAHSIGCYICQQMHLEHSMDPLGDNMKRAGADNSSRFNYIYLFPALYDLRRNAGFIKTTLSYFGFRHVFAAVAGMLGTLPTRLQDIISATAGAVDCPDAPRQLFKYNVALNVMTMLRSECENVVDLDLDSVKCTGGRTHYIYTNDDIWAPRDHYQTMRSIIGDNDVIFIEVCLLSW